MESEPGTTIFYTTDGRDPTPASTEYTGRLELGVGQKMVKAISVLGGVGSEITSSFYSYTPKSLSVQPESGTFSGSVRVSIFSEHAEVRYTLDGLLPSSQSELYTGPIIIAQEGTHTLTAAMFSNGSLIGDPIRRKYVVNELPPQPPIVSPSSGTYECPLRIILEGDSKTIYYTFDDETPSMASTLYTGPLVISSPCEVNIRAILYDAKQRSSSVVHAKYIVTRAAEVGESHAETVIPLSNVEFNQAVESTARRQAEEVMSFVLAATELKEKRAAEVVRLKRVLTDSRQNYLDTVEKTRRLQLELNLANEHLRRLRHQKATHVCHPKVDVHQKLEDARADLQLISQQEKSIEAQLKDSLALHKRLTDERTKLAREQIEIKKGLEERYLRNKKTLVGFPANVKEEVHSLQLATAEQRHELALLKATKEALKPSHHFPVLPGESDQEANPFLPPRKLIELPSVETLLPIPPGSMRKITSVRGDGLQNLRKKHSVDACIVDAGGRLSIRIIGHSVGVHNCVDEIEKLLEAA
jgi:hypothetical protein